MKNFENIPNHNGEEETKSIRDYLVILNSGKWIILLCFILVFSASIIYTFSVDPRYEATTSILVLTPQAGRSFGIPLLDIVGISEQKKINNEIEILNSNSLIEEVANRFLKQVVLTPGGNDTLSILMPAKFDETASVFAKKSTIMSRLKANVKIESKRESDVIHIKCTSKFPEEAAFIANTYAEAYYERNLDLSRSHASGVREFLGTQNLDKKRALKAAESAVQSFMEQKGIVSLDEESKKIIDRISQFEANYGQVHIELESAEKTLSVLKSQLNEIEPRIAKNISDAVNPYIKLLQDQIAQLEVKKDVTQSQNPAGNLNPIFKQTVKDLDDQIASLRKKLNDKIEEYMRSIVPAASGSTNISDPAIYAQQLRYKIFEQQVVVASLQAKIVALKKVIEQYEKDFTKIPKTSIEYARLHRAHLSSEKLYLFVEEKYQEALIGEQSQFGYLQIFDKALIPVEPVSPKVFLNLIIGLCLGLGLGIGIVIAKERFNVTIKSPDEIKNYGITVLSTIPLMDEQIKKVNGKSVAYIQDVAIDAHLISFLNPLSPISESYRRLRTGIQFIYPDKKMQVILITSPSSGEGKSTTVSNLGITFAQAGKKVVILDTDFRKPNLHIEFGLDKGPGITDILFDSNKIHEVIKNTVVENLFLITCGSIPPNPSELLGSEKMKNFVEELKKEYDIILFDSPPVLAVTDAELLATISDGVILVIKAEETQKEILIRALELLNSVGAKVIGSLLNGFNPKHLTGKYKYYYSRYGRYPEEVNR